MGREKVALHGLAREAAVTMGQEIRIARHSKKWSQQKLAKHAGISERTVSLIERGDPAVAWGNVLNAAVAAGVALFQAEDRDELARMRYRGEEKLSLLPKRVVERDMSDVERDF